MAPVLRPSPALAVILPALTSVGLLLAGCGTTDAKTPAPVSPPRPSSAAHALSDPTPTMAMPAGTAPAKPTTTQALVCGDDARGDIRTALNLRADPATDSTYADALFTCDYHLPAGLMRLSVKHLTDPAAAQTYLTTQSRTVNAPQHLAGLGDSAYGNGAGLVYTIKDNEVLAVDTTRLPAVFGPQHQKRSDLAYEVASIILGCWTGDDT